MTEIASITRKLHQMGIAQSLIDQVRAGATPDVPAIKAPVLKRLREVIGVDQRAVLVLCTNGEYKVFSFEGHEVLRASAKRHKPWTLTKKSHLKH